VSCTWLSTKQVAEQLQLSPAFVHGMIKRGDIEVLALPGRGRKKVYRICAGELSKYIVNKAQGRLGL